MNEHPLNDDLMEEDIQSKEVEYAGFWIRVGASVIDSLVMIPIIILTFYNIIAIKSLFFMFILTLIASLYKPFLEWRYGATFGKMAVKIRVVNEQMGNLSLGQAFGRYIPWAITQVLSFITYYYLFTSANFQEVNSFMQIGELSQTSPIETTSTVYNFIFIFIVGSLAFDPKKQGFHDKIAKTFCIKTK